MARCGCGSDCGCALVAGTGTTVSGSGTQANPWVVNAVTNCAEVRQCLDNGCGLLYNSTTGVFSVNLSEDANNAVECRGNGLYVAAGAATVTAGCGFNGNGAPATPLTLNTNAWPFACTQDSNTAQGVYCDPATGEVHGDPKGAFSFYQDSENVQLAGTGIAIPVSETDIRPISLDITNTDPCRPADVILWQDVDCDMDLPAGAGGMYGLDGDDLVYLENQGGSTIFSTHAQSGKVRRLTLAAGASTTVTGQITAGRGMGGARIRRIQWAMRAFVITIP